MASAYVASLVIGAAFVGLSLLSGDGSVDVDADVDLDLDLDVDLAPDVDGPSLGDAAHGVDPHKPRKRFNPLLSMRFWTFALAGFGLTGVLLSALELSVEPLTAGLSIGVGVILGVAVAAATRALSIPVRGATISIGDYVGRAATLLHAVDPGGVAKLRVSIGQGTRDLLGRTAEPRALAANTRVVILSMDPDGRAVVSPEGEFFTSTTSTQEEVEV